MKWQPIKTAPKDETDILVWARGKVHVAYYDDLGCGWLDAHDCGDYAGHLSATHWMPLPAPPEA